MTMIEIPDEQAAALSAQAAAHGFTLEAWLGRLAEAEVGWTGRDARRLRACQERFGGVWVFKNTRMPVSVVFENLEDGVTIDELIELYDGLTRDQVEAGLDFAARSLD